VFVEGGRLCHGHNGQFKSECTGVSNVVEIGRKSVPGGWVTVGETSFSKSSSCCYVMHCDAAKSKSMFTMAMGKTHSEKKRNISGYLQDHLD